MNPEKPSTVAAAARKAGLEVVDNQTLAALRHDAQQGRAMAAAAKQQKIEATVDDAISKGKITPARRKHWVTLIEADPGMADVLAAVPNETAVPMTEIGPQHRGRRQRRQAARLVLLTVAAGGPPRQAAAAADPRAPRPHLLTGRGARDYH